MKPTYLMFPSFISATNTFVVVMFVIFLGIVPAALTVLCLTYYASGDLEHWWKTKGRPATSKYVIYIFFLTFCR